MSEPSPAGAFPFFPFPPGRSALNSDPSCRAPRRNLWTTRERAFTITPSLMKTLDRRICPLLILFCFLALVACSNKGNNVSASVQAKAPVANAGGPYTGPAVQPVRFDGTGSSDPQGQTLTYIWNFGDGQTGTGASPTHVHAARGSYSVSLSVTDTSNLASLATTTAIISSPPVANAGGPYTGIVGTPISMSGG